MSNDEASMYATYAPDGDSNLFFSMSINLESQQK